jgi:hypothetical protein
MRAAVRLAAIMPVVVGLAHVALSSLAVARSDALVLAASTEMGTWAARRALPSPETWSATRDKLEKADRIRALGPTGSELMGLLASLRGDSPEQMTAAITYLTRALELRPASPYTWINFAEAQYRRGEPGRNLELAMGRSVQLGPAEPGVQRLVADYGLAVWDEVTPQTRAVVDRMVGAGMRRNPLEMLQISERRGRLDTACRHLAGQRTPDPRWTKLCPDREITP